MDMEKRLKAAREVLGTFRVKSSGSKAKTRPISSFIEKKHSGHRDMSQSEYQQCGRKKRYNSESDASQSANAIKDRFGKPMRAYLCPYCNGWHLTSQIEKLGDHSLKHFGKTIRKHLKGGK